MLPQLVHVRVGAVKLARHLSYQRVSGTLELRVHHRQLFPEPTDVLLILGKLGDHFVRLAPQLRLQRLHVPVHTRAH